MVVDDSYSASNSTLRATFLSIGIPEILVGAWCTYLFWQRRNEHPIKGRTPGFIVVCNIAAMLYALLVVVHVSSLETFPCVLHYLARVVFDTIICVFYVMRCWTLLFRYKLTQELATADNIARSGTPSKQPSDLGRIDVDVEDAGDYVPPQLDVTPAHRMTTTDHSTVAVAGRPSVLDKSRSRQVTQISPHPRSSVVSTKALRHVDSLGLALAVNHNLTRPNAQGSAGVSPASPMDPLDPGQSSLGASAASPTNNAFLLPRSMQAEPASRIADAYSDESDMFLQPSGRKMPPSSDSEETTDDSNMDGNSVGMLRLGSKRDNNGKNSAESARNETAMTRSQYSGATHSLKPSKTAYSLYGRARQQAGSVETDRERRASATSRYTALRRAGTWHSTDDRGSSSQPELSSIEDSEQHRESSLLIDGPNTLHAQEAEEQSLHSGANKSNARSLLSSGHSTRSLPMSSWEPVQGWYTSHRYLLTNRSIAYTCAIAEVALLIPAVAILATSDFDGHGKCPHRAIDVYAAVSVSLAACIFLYLVSQLHDVVEAYQIKREMLITTGFFSTLFILWFVVIYGELDNEYPWRHFIILMMMAVLVFTSTVFPLVLFWRMSREHHDTILADQLLGSPSRSIPVNVDSAASTDEIDLSSLAGVIANDFTRAAFKAHLCKEFSVENLLFLEQIAYFKHHVTTMRESTSYRQEMEIGFKDEAYFLYMQFIRTGSSFEINLPYHIKNELEQHFERGTENPSEQLLLPHANATSSREISRYIPIPGARFGDASTPRFQLSPSVTRFAPVNQYDALKIPLSSSADIGKFGGFGATGAGAARIASRSGRPSMVSGLASYLGSRRESHADDVKSIGQDSGRNSPAFDQLIVEPFDENVFNAGFDSIFDLLNRDSFARFVLTTEYAFAVNEARAESRIQRAYSDALRSLHTEDGVASTYHRAHTK